MRNRYVNDGARMLAMGARRRAVAGCASLQATPQCGAAMTETIVALLALSPFILGAPLLGKQLDIKHKAFDAARYGVWERTVWRSDGVNRKSDHDLLLEARDRALGDPRAGVLGLERLRAEGITENPWWRDRQGRRLIDYEQDAISVSMQHEERPVPVEIGRFLAPGVAYGDGPLAAIASALQLESLALNRRAFVGASIAIGVRPLLARAADQPPTLAERNAPERDHAPIVQRAAGAVLSDTWSSNDENHFRRRVDALTADEHIATLEAPGRIIALQALGRGRPLYGEGQYGWDADLRVQSTALPSAYIARQ